MVSLSNLELAPSIAGVKFNDADLVGLPVRLVISPRTLRQGSVEVKGRREERGRLVGMGEVGEVVSKDNFPRIKDIKNH